MLKDFVKQCEPLPQDSKLLVLGGGFSGQHLAALARKLGTNVVCSRRTKDKKGADWIYMPQGPFKNETSLKSYLKDKNLTGNPFFYTIYSKRLKTFCGLASYLRIQPNIGTIEVGYITYAKNLQRTVEATEAMFLMMKNVFDNLGYRRYEWKCDNLNNRSKKLALRLGFKFEGVFRQATIYKKRNRDTAWYSIIDKEWKILKKKYNQYLKKSNFNNKLIQKKKLNLF